MERGMAGPEPPTRTTDPFFLFLPIGIGVAIGLHAPHAWWQWTLAVALATSFLHVLTRSWHYRQYVAGMGKNSSNFVYLLMRIPLESLKVGIPALIALAVKQ